MTVKQVDDIKNKTVQILFQNLEPAEYKKVFSLLVPLFGYAMKNAQIDEYLAKKEAILRRNVNSQEIEKMCSDQGDKTADASSTVVTALDVLMLTNDLLEQYLKTVNKS